MRNAHRERISLNFSRSLNVCYVPYYDKLFSSILHFHLVRRRYLLREGTKKQAQKQKLYKINTKSVKEICEAIERKKYFLPWEID